MTLFEELGVEYKEVDGILYPLLSVDEAEYNLTDIGKYGRMWLRYMKENNKSNYEVNAFLILIFFMSLSPK